MAIGAAILRVAPSLIPEGLLPATVTLAFDARIVAFCAVTAVAVGLTFGLVPAWKATDFSSAEVLGSDSRTMTRTGGRLRGLLVTGEVAMAVLLLFGAGLLLRSLVAVDAFDRGYRAESVLSILVDPLGSKYPTPESLQQFFDQVEAEVAAVPGVASVGWAEELPLDFFDAGWLSFEIVGDPPVDQSQRLTTEYQIVSPTYFSTLELPILSGRAFDKTDTRDGVQVCIVNEAFVRDLHGRNPIGLKVALRPAGSPQAKPNVREIVGVARQVKGRPDEIKDFVQVYVPMAQDLSDDMFLVVRPTSGRAETLAPAIRAAISRVDTEQLVSVRNVMTLEDIAWTATSRHRFRAVMVIAFAALALVLAACTLTRPAVVKRTFLLDPPLPAPVASSKPLTLRVSPFNVAAPYRDRAFVYRTAELSFESDFYDEFFVSPGAMIAEATLRALSQSRVFARVVPGSTAAEEGDLVLDAFITDLYGDTRGAKAEAEIGISFYVSRTGFPTAVVWSRDYRRRVPLAANTPDALAQAWNVALGQILADLTRDLGAATFNAAPPGASGS